MRVLLIKPGSQKKNYQELSYRFTAHEPPVWLAMRAAELTKQGHVVGVYDEEMKYIDEKTPTDHIEIIPFGNHPSAFIQQREGVKEKLFIDGKNAYIRWWDRVPEFDINQIPLWELLPMHSYRTHNWHSWGGRKRSPYGVLFTSISCPFSCSFCAIRNYYGEKFIERDIPVIINDLKKQYDMGIRDYKIIDEMFWLKDKRVEEICDRIIAEGFTDLNMWCFARVDRINNSLLPKIKKAGIRWLGIGIESGTEEIRKKESKGGFSNKTILEITKSIKDSGIYLCPNYMFGFEDDNYDTMRRTIDLAKDIQGECANFNCMMPFPGTGAYMTAIKNGWELPETWSGYSQHSYDSLPLRTKYCTSKEVLQFRDNAFTEYYTDNNYLSMIDKTFGISTIEDIKLMTSIKLKRKLFDEV